MVRGAVSVARVNRQERLALNESRFRELNEQLVAAELRFGQADEGIEVLCECGDENCAAPLLVTPSEYQQARSDPELFLVLPPHVHGEVEQVVVTNERFALVRKTGVAREIAHETNPRDSNSAA